MSALVRSPWWSRKPHYVDDHLQQLDRVTELGIDGHIGGIPARGDCHAPAVQVLLGAYRVADHRRTAMRRTPESDDVG